MHTGSNPRRSRGCTLRVAVVCALLCHACASVPPSPGNDVRMDKSLNEGRPVSQIQLRDSIERFTGQFIDRVGEAIKELEVHDKPELQQLALRQGLVYTASTLDIATGPLPEVNLLDMLVFVALSRSVLEQHW